MHYEDFTLEIQPHDRRGLQTRVLHSLAGGGSAPFEPPYEPAELADVLHELEGLIGRGGTLREVDGGGEPRPRANGRGIREVGERLYRSLFTGAVARRFEFSRGRVAGDSEAGLRLRISLQAEDRTDASLAALPWELLRDGETGSYLARSRLTPVVRCLDVTAPTTPPPAEPPLRVLVTLANPPGSRPLDLPAERDRIEEAWGKQPLVEIEYLEQATLEAVRAALRREPFQVLHAIGHGRFEDSKGEGTLLLEDGAGGGDAVTGERLATALRDFPSLRLVFLNACDTGRFPRRGGLDPYTAVASSLVAAGVPAVIAMQFPISDRAAKAFSAGFYRALATAAPVDAAVAEGRHAVCDDDPKSLEWATPVLYLRASESRLLAGVVSEHRVSADIRRRIVDSDRLVEEKTRGFVGRRFVFEALEELCTRHPRGYLRIEGDPGIGKSTVLAEMVRRGDPPHHFNQRPEGVVHPEAFLSNVCAQLVARYGLEVPSLPEPALRDGAFLSQLLDRVSRHLPDGERCVILVDALDETDVDGLPPGANPLFLPSTLPEGVYVVVSSRTGAVRLRIDCEQDEVPLIHDSERNRADVRELVESYLDRPGIRHYVESQDLAAEGFVELMDERSEGNFMYLSYVLPAIDRGELRGFRPTDLPRGLLGYYEQHFELLRGRDDTAWTEWKLPVLEALAVAVEPFPRDLIAIASGVENRHRLSRALELWRPFLHVHQERDETGAPVRLYRIYHQSFREFLAAHPSTDLAAAEERLVDRFLEVQEAGGRGGGRSGSAS